jgi:hypothetical protein
MRSLFALGFVLAVVPLASACGAETPAAPAGASVAPASAQLFLTVDTSFDSAQWENARTLLEKFPDGEKALDLLFGKLGARGIDFDRDVKPALGPETDVVGLDLSGEDEFVGLTQPEDLDKLKALLDRTGQQFVFRAVGDWTAFSDKATVLDKFESARADGTLADSSDFQDAIDQVSGDAVARLYLNGSALQKSGLSAAIDRLAIAVKAESGGVGVEGAAKLAENGEVFGSEPFKAELPEEVPGGALVYVDVNDLGAQLKALRDVIAQADPSVDADIARAEHELGVSLDEDVFPLFSGETAFYVRRGLIIPEVTLVTHVDDAQAAVAALDKLVQGLREYLPMLQDEQELQIDGVTAKVVPLGGPISLYYAAFDGHLVVTTSQDGIAALREHDDRLADDPDFKAALDQAGVPDETTGFGYVNLKSAIPYVLGLFEMSGGTAPQELRANLEPLQQLTFYGTKDGSTVKFDGFLAVD